MYPLLENPILLADFLKDAQAQSLLPALRAT
jgi:hypothetical protein